MFGDRNNYFTSSDPHHGSKSYSPGKTMMKCVGMIQQVTGILFWLWWASSSIAWPSETYLASHTTCQCTPQTFTYHLLVHFTVYMTFNLAFNLAFYLWRLIWHSIWHSLWHLFWHPDLTFLSDILSAFFFSAQKVRRKKSGEPCGDQKLAGEVPQGGRWSPASLTAITSWQVMSGDERRRKKEGRRTSWHLKI